MFYILKIDFLINFRMNFRVEIKIVFFIKGLFLKNNALLNIKDNSFLLRLMNKNTYLIT